ncbi:MAG: hypothetical protein ACJA0H_001418 [Francisellaceae bacterium]|jgi:hypothetical protein
MDQKYNFSPSIINNIIRDPVTDIITGSLTSKYSIKLNLNPARIQHQIDKFFLAHR